MFPAIIGGIASVMGSMIGAKGQADTNTANAHEAERNRAFQERMRSSQWQTSVEDMRKAGLNPALAYQQGGAGTPTGATAVHQNPAAGAQTAAASAVQTFQDMRRTNAEIERTTAETDRTRTETQLTNQNLLLRILDKELGYKTYGDALERLKAESRQSVSSAAEAEASTRIRQLAIPEAEAISNFYRSNIGKLDPYINSASGAAGTLTKLIPFMRTARMGKKLLPRVNRDHTLRN